MTFTVDITNIRCNHACLPSKRYFAVVCVFIYVDSGPKVQKKTNALGQRPNKKEGGNRNSVRQRTDRLIEHHARHFVQQTSRTRGFQFFHITPKRILRNYVLPHTFLS